MDIRIDLSGREQKKRAVAEEIKAAKARIKELEAEIAVETAKAAAWRRRGLH